MKRTFIYSLLEEKIPVHRFKHCASLMLGLSLMSCGLGGCGGGHSGGSSSPANDPAQAVVFQSDRDGDFEILQMNGDGSNITRVTDNLANDSAPCLSPDKRSVAFVSNRTGNNEIFIIDTQGTRQLTHNNYKDSEPTFSPDGRKILFTSERDGNIDLFIVDVTNQIEKRLTYSRAVENSGVFIFDGRIVFSSNSSKNFYQIYVMNGGGSQMKQITQIRGFNQTLPSVSPDGRTIVFVMRNEISSNIYLMDIDGHNVRTLMDESGNNTEPVFSRDGKRIFFSSNRTGNFEIYSVNLDGLDLRNLTRNPAADRIPGA